MTAIQVGNVTIGDRVPKICVSLCGKTRQEVLEKGRLLAESAAAIIEWRLDYLEPSMGLDELVVLTGELVQCLQSKPLLLTFRTLAEGGQRALSSVEYVRLYDRLLEVQGIDLIDLEFFLGSDVLTPLIKKSHEKEIKVIVSNHEFDETPSKAAIISRLLAMADIGADISKLAAMPQTAQDVLTLMSATSELSQREDSGPIVTMSMGELGKISRVAGKLTGSALTFGAVEETSAPGQLELSQLIKIMNQL